jgi:type IV pilus assembly protein PilA
MSLFAKAKKIKENKKGFTLVELIVVLVILAILAAFLVPALTGYIDKAKEKSIIAETRSVVMAAQTLSDEAYAKVNKGATITAPAAADVQALAEVSGTVSDITYDTTNSAKVKSLKYTSGGLVCTYDASASETYSVVKSTS